jgi:hypothetical protein
MVVVVITMLAACEGWLWIEGLKMRKMRGYGYQIRGWNIGVSGVGRVGKGVCEWELGRGGDFRVGVGMGRD